MSNVVLILENIIAAFAIYGWPTMKNHIIVRIVASAVSVEPKTFSTAMIAECVSTRVCTQTTTVKVESTNPTVQSVKNFSLVLEALLMKCLADMQFTGTASDNWQHMIPDVPSARKQPKQRIA